MPHAEIPDDHGGKVGVEVIAGQRDGSGMSRATFLGVVVAAVVRASADLTLGHPTRPTFRPASPDKSRVQESRLRREHGTANGTSKKDVSLDHGSDK